MEQPVARREPGLKPMARMLRDWIGLAQVGRFSGRPNEQRSPTGPGLAGSPIPSGWAAGLDVMVVDDNASSRFLIEKYFKDSGARLRAAENGAEAVSLYAECRADLVLLDLAMPVMDGNQAARRIRALEKERNWPAATLAALTANSAPAARAAAYEAGMNAFLEKPLRRQVLVTYVLEHLSASG